MTTIPSMEQLSCAYESHVTELGDLLRARYEYAEAIELSEYTESILKARLRVAGLDGKNEDDRKANLFLALEADTEYQTTFCNLREAQHRRDSVDVSLELKRLRMRLLGWQMEWLIAQKGAEDESPR